MKKSLFSTAIALAVVCSGLTIIAEPAQAGYSRCQGGANAGSYCFRYGDRGPLVYDFIEELRCAGYYRVGNDSWFGPVTQRAVKAFQRDNGLVADGVAGPQTRNVLISRNRRWGCR
ncbi:MAG: peptidoglycan-binding domain-containing protein [Spirulinaceae cyanobacterium]